MGRAIVNRGTPQAVVIPQTAEVGSRGIVNRGSNAVARGTSRGLVNRSAPLNVGLAVRPDTPLADTPEPKQIV